MYIGRGTPLGNPFRLKSAGGIFTREESIEAFESYLRAKLAERNMEVCCEMNRLYRIARERELILLCSCAPLACHGDVVRRILLEAHAAKQGP